MQRREYILQESISALKGGTCQAVSISGTSAQSAAINSGRVVIYSNVDCWMRQGSNPTALSNGTDQFIPANTLLRIVDIESGNKLAFIAGSAGTVYISP
jgi:hypothetical protein